MRILFALALIGGLATTTARAGAQPAGAPPAASPPDEASRAQAAARFGEAQAAFARGAYRASAEAFEAAAALSPHPSVWLNAAEAWDLAGEPLAAAQDCDRALAMQGVSDAEASEAKKRLTKLAAKLGRIEITGAPSLHVALDDEAPQALPVSRWAQPGKHRLRIHEGDATREMEIELAAGLSRSIELAPTVAGGDDARGDGARGGPTEAGTPGGAPGAGTESKPAGPNGAPPAATWVCFGVAGAGAVVTAIFGGLTVAAQSDFDEAPTRDAADAFDRDKLVTNVALGVTLVAATAGAVIWIVDAATSGGGTAVRVAPSTAGATLSISHVW